MKLNAFNIKVSINNILFEDRNASVILNLKSDQNEISITLYFPYLIIFATRKSSKSSFTFSQSTEWVVATIKHSLRAISDRIEVGLQTTPSKMIATSCGCCLMYSERVSTDWGDFSSCSYAVTRSVLGVMRWASSSSRSLYYVIWFWISEVWLLSASPSRTPSV